MGIEDGALDLHQINLAGTRIRLPTLGVRESELQCVAVDGYDDKRAVVLRDAKV
jgi:hypothetical protein